MNAWSAWSSNMPYYCSSILNSSMLPLHLTNGCQLTDRSNLPFPCLGLCKSLMWLGWGMPGERWGCLARDKFATSWTHSPQQPPVQAGHCHPWQIMQGHHFKTLAVACEFWSAFRVKRWQVAYKEHNANGVYFRRVISNLEQCLASLTNSCFNANEAVRERGGRGRHSSSRLCHQGKCWQIHSISPWSVCLGTI